MTFESIIDTLNSWVWSNYLVALCLGAGIYFSVSTRFLQVRYIKEMLRLLFKGKSSQKGVSSFQAFAIAISGRVGTGNIAGVATAIAMGGPGAVFWMWVIAFLGASSAYVEATLGQIYKEVKGGEYRGGPAYYIEKGLGSKWYAVLFAFTTVLSMSIFLPGVQSNSISASMKSAFNIQDIALFGDFNLNIVGLLIIVALSLIIFGGVKRIGKVAEVVVPFMALSYILMAVVIIFINIQHVPGAIALIIKSAFGAEQAFAGILGMAISWGVKRGIYSNEAGQGTAPHAASAAEVSHPAKQGLVQAFSVYVDTLFVCTATAFMILFTEQYNVVNPEGGFIVENLPGVAFGPEYTQHAVALDFPSIGKAFVAISLFFFAFTTIMAYYYMAETNVAYLDKSGNKKYMVTILRVVILATTYYATTITAGAVWSLGDIGVGLMAWLNVIAILLLRKPAFKALKDYSEQLKAGKDPVFNSTKLGIKNASFWENKGVDTN
ncbi:MAG: alanine:cation symporter family protein [Cyclobacteriaceae bacterium]|nr:alanine:cation symporter family protein [Cyclobacteriaceae bacterium]